MARNPPIFPEAIDAVAAELERLSQLPPKQLAKVLILTYLEAHRQREAKRIGGHIGQAARDIAALKEGEFRIFEPTALQVLRARMKSARKLLNNPKAEWTCSTLLNGQIQVMRLNDGEKRTRQPNKLAFELAAMAVDEEKFMSGLTQNNRDGRYVINTNIKTQARRILNLGSAQWSVKNFGTGPKVKRIK